MRAGAPLSEGSATGASPLIWQRQTKNRDPGDSGAHSGITSLCLALSPATGFFWRLILGAVDEPEILQQVSGLPWDSSTDPMPVQWTLTEHDNVFDHSRHISPGPLLFDGSSDRIDELTEQFLHVTLTAGDPRRSRVGQDQPGGAVLATTEVRIAADPSCSLELHQSPGGVGPVLQSRIAARLSRSRRIDAVLRGFAVDTTLAALVLQNAIPTRL